MNENTNKANCSCNPCHASTCGCRRTSAREGAGTVAPTKAAACCCGPACGCGPACECPAGCGCG
ncbi:MAG: hypothetical protein QM820_39400 [Minicystis sp.]